MTMQVIRTTTFEADMRLALNQFIGMYFDGNAHLIAGTAVTFPAVKVTFGRPLVARPLTPTQIVFTPLPSPNQDFRASHVMRKLNYQVLAIAADASGKTQAKISTLLGVIFSQCRDVLAASGIRTQQVGEPIFIADNIHEYGVSQRIVRFMVDLTAGAAAHGSASEEEGMNKTLYSDEVNLLVAGLATVVVPAGFRFFVNKVGIYTTECTDSAPAGTLVQPVVQWGIPGQTDKYKSAIQTSFLTDAFVRETYDSGLSTDVIATALQAEIITPATGKATYKGKFFFEGQLV